jgi:hypothetical protein
VSAVRKGAGKRKFPSARISRNTRNAAVFPRPGGAQPVSIDSILEECVSATSLIEVTLHSLEAREIGHPEQEVLKRALKVIWSVYDWIDNRRPRHARDDKEVES